MVDCDLCDADDRHEAVMYCANCGKPICEEHVTNGTYCSQQCADEDDEEVVGFGERHRALQEIRGKKALIMGAIMAIVVFVVVYLMLSGGL